jgi:hypothetical protein
VVGLAGARLRGSVSPGDIADFFNAFKAASFIGRLLLAKDIVVAINNLPMYDRDT